MRRSLRRLDESDDHLLGVSMSFTITLVPSFPINPRTFPSPHETPRGCGCDGLVGSNPQVRVRSNSVDWLCVPSFPSRRFVFYQLVFGISRMFSSQNEYLSQIEMKIDLVFVKPYESVCFLVWHRVCNPWFADERFAF